MRFRIVHGLAAIGIFATCLYILTCVAHAQDAATAVGVKELAEASRKAKADYRPLSADDAQEAKKQLLDAMKKLERRLAQDGENGKAWGDFLELDTLHQQLADPQGADNTILAGLLAHYHSGHDGLELVWFLDVQNALHHYLAMTFAVGNSDIQTAFNAKIDLLAESLERYAAKPTTEDALVIGESLRWLKDAKQTPNLVEAIERAYGNPNLYGAISPAILGAGIEGDVDDVTAVRDCILGTDIYGSARTIGRTSIELTENDAVGMFDTLFFGTTNSDNVGYHGPVTIYSNSTTDLSARKRLWIDAEGLSAHPGVSQAATEVNICDIQSRKGRQMIERLAWKRACKQKGLAECIASRHAEQRLNQRIDQQADEALQRANQAYVDKFYRPFHERKLFPQELKFSSNKKGISLVGLQAGGSKLGAPGEPPPVCDEAELSLRLHESMINNLAFDALAGRTIYEEKLQAAVKETLGELPEKMKGDEDGKPWAITFAPRQPISVTFADDGFQITLRGVRFYKGSEVYNDPMNITAAYKTEKTPKGVKAVRQGDIQVFPPDFKPGDQVGGRQQIIRTLLAKRFEKVFEPEIIGEGFEMSGKWKSLGKLIPIEVVCRDGWLVLGWKRAAAAEQQTAAK